MFYYYHFLKKIIIIIVIIVIIIIITFIIIILYFMKLFTPQCKTYKHQFEYDLPLLAHLSSKEIVTST